MVTTIADLTEDLVVEILPRVPVTSLGSVRCTCKKWNALSKNRIFGKEGASKNQFLGFMVMDSRVCSLRFDLQGIRNDGDDFIDLSINQVSVLNQIEVSKAYHCDGLLLCVLNDNSRLLVWNPYLGQMRWIQLKFNRFDRIAIGYDSNRNHKILKIGIGRNRGFGCAIYEFGSNSWRTLDFTPNWFKPIHQRGVTLNGNAYFYVQEIIREGDLTGVEKGLLCFDFTSEKFGPRLSLPFISCDDEPVTLSCVRDEKLAVLHQRWELCEIMEIWVTSNIDHNELLWTKFLRVDMKVLTGFSSFFIDEEKKVAVVFDLDVNEPSETRRYQTAHIIGQDGYFKSINFGEAPNEGKPDKFGYTLLPVLSSSYVPSLVHIE